MLRIVALAPQVLLIALIHDEEAVIANVLADLANQDYPADLVDAWVLADRCTDRTADIARRQVSVVERFEGPDGKAAALNWYLDQHPLRSDEVLVVVDADNRLPVDLLARMADEFDGGAEAVQAYLDVSNPDASLLASASAVSYWASNRMVQLARHNLGWTADLGGTGMALTAEALDAAGGIGTSTTEDQDLCARLLIADTPVHWLHDVRIADEKPSSLGVAVRQRARWASGKSGVRKRLLADLLRLRSAAGLDLVIRLTQPSRTFVALLTGILAVVAALVGGDYLFSWQVWLTVAVLQFIAPLPFLVREGVGFRFLWRYPLLAVFGIIYLPVRVLGRLTEGWYHTPHEGG
jgi:cellulose synthase/poly-beta-1,6-N-acetylglucosamine synthase-like glycosyltransferase